jgi:FKBP-type peptidyl-prolyl cis-trans isomerase
MPILSVKQPQNIMSKNSKNSNNNNSNINPQATIKEKMQDPIVKNYIFSSILYAVFILVVVVGIVWLIVDKTANDNKKETPFPTISSVIPKPKTTSTDPAEQTPEQKAQIEAQKKTQEQKILTQVKPAIKVVTVQEGAGDEVAFGDTATVNYTGKLEDGTVFDSSLNTGRQPFPVEGVGFAGVIDGWNAGLLGLKKGGKYTLTIPPQFAYGAQVKTGIPANSTLVFDIEVLDIAK